MKRVRLSIILLAVFAVSVEAADVADRAVGIDLSALNFDWAKDDPHGNPTLKGCARLHDWVMRQPAKKHVDVIIEVDGLKAEMSCEEFETRLFDTYK